MFGDRWLRSHLLSPRSQLLRNGCTPRGSGEIGLKQKGLGRDSSRGLHRPGKTDEVKGWWLVQPTGTKKYCLSILTAAPSSPPWTPLRRCGYPKRNMKKMAPVRFIAKPSNAQGEWTYWERGKKGEPEPLTPSGLGSCCRPRVPCMPSPRSRWRSHARL